MLMLSGCGLFHRGDNRPSSTASATGSTTASASATASPTPKGASLSQVLAATRGAGGAAVSVSSRLTGQDTASGSFDGVLSLDTGTGRGDYTSANGRTSERIISGGRTYTSTGSAWVATTQSGRGLLGGDLPTLWRLLGAMQWQSEAGTIRGSIPLAEALQASSIDPNVAAAIPATGQRAQVSVTHDAAGVANRVSIVWEQGARALTVTVDIKDVGQVIDVTAPTNLVTGGPESQ